MSRRRRSPDPGATQQPVQNQRGRQLQASNWYPDPVRRHQYRYWNGTAWTEHVADAGRQSSDPLTPVTPVMPVMPVIVAAPPEKRHLFRNAAIAVGAVALGLTADSTAEGALLDALERETDIATRAELLDALGRTGGSASLAALAAMRAEGDSRAILDDAPELQALIARCLETASPVPRVRRSAPRSEVLGPGPELVPITKYCRPVASSIARSPRIRRSPSRTCGVTP